MVKADLRGGHQRGGHSRHPRRSGQLFDLGYFPPPAEVLDESARVTGAAGHLGQRARPGQYGVDRGGRDGHLPGVKDLADAGNTIPREGRYHFLISKTGGIAAL